MINLPKIKTIVYGPAYLDVVIRVGGPLANQGEPSIDQGGTAIYHSDTQLTKADALFILDKHGNSIKIEGVTDQGLTGIYRMLSPDFQFADRVVYATQIVEDLGGMGAGFAKLFEGNLISCLPVRKCHIREKIEKKLNQYGVVYQPILINHKNADWTLLISSGRFGDKLPIGLRGCHDQFSENQLPNDLPSADLVIVASLKNEIMLEILRRNCNSIRLLAPALRNCQAVQGAISLSALATHVEMLTLNEVEWQSMGENDRQIWQDSHAILCITRGPAGAEISWQGLDGRREYHHEPAFARAIDPVDTNRAGEAFGGTLMKYLIKQNWFNTEKVDAKQKILYASQLAAVAAGLTIQMPEFAFPGEYQIEMTLQSGIIK